MLKFLKRKPSPVLVPPATEFEQFPAVDQIGLTAGEIWGVLAEHGGLDLSCLVARSSGSRDEVLLAIGWLAREGKVKMSEANIVLVPNEFRSVA